MMSEVFKLISPLQIPHAPPSTFLLLFENYGHHMLKMVVPKDEMRLIQKDLSQCLEKSYLTHIGCDMN